MILSLINIFYDYMVALLYLLWLYLYIFLFLSFMIIIWQHCYIFSGRGFLFTSVQAFHQLFFKFIWWIVVRSYSTISVKVPSLISGIFGWQVVSNVISQVEKGQIIPSQLVPIQMVPNSLYVVSHPKYTHMCLP